MVKKMAVSAVRQELTGLLRRLQKNPDLHILITRSGTPVGELTAPRRHATRIAAGKILSTIAEKVGPPDVPAPSAGSVAEDHDEFLYT